MAGTSAELRAQAEAHSAHNYHPLPVVIAEAEGAWVTDVDGRRYVDMLAAYSAINFGHRHPRLVAAAQRQLERVTLEVYRRGAELAASRGIVIADTKLEFGLADDGTLMLADEVLTPDSSRFWLAAEWQPGRPQRSLDKQFLRDWSAGLDWDRRPPGPAIPPEIVAATRDRYLELYARLTGSRLG